MHAANSCITSRAIKGVELPNCTFFLPELRIATGITVVCCMYCTAAADNRERMPLIGVARLPRKLLLPSETSF